jgi:hypothetical protein
MNALRKDFLGTKSLPVGAPVPSSPNEHLPPVAGVDTDGVDDDIPQSTQGKRFKPADDVVSLGDLISDIQEVFDDMSQNWKKHESEIMNALVIVDHVSSSLSSDASSLTSDPRW